MGAIVPAILPTSREDLERRLERLTGLTDRVQIDVVDGRFADGATWPYTEGFSQFSERVAQGEFLPHAGEFHFEMDLMVTEPELQSGTWLTAGASAITFHASSTGALDTAIDELRAVYGHDQGFVSALLSVGIALAIDMDTALVERYLDRIDYVQFMGIAHIGRQGEPFDPRVIRKIQAFRAKHPRVPIRVDGGVSLKTAPALIDAGVSELIVGSDLWHAPDLGAELERLRSLFEEYGLYQS